MASTVRLIGSIYNVKTKGMEPGLGALPHPAFWQEVGAVRTVHEGYGLRLAAACMASAGQSIGRGRCALQ